MWWTNGSISLPIAEGIKSLMSRASWYKLNLTNQRAAFDMYLKWELIMLGVTLQWTTHALADSTKSTSQTLSNIHDTPTNYNKQNQTQYGSMWMLYSAESLWLLITLKVPARPLLLNGHGCLDLTNSIQTFGNPGQQTCPIWHGLSAILS